MKLTKEMLIDWIDRPPSNSDLDLINYIIELQNNRDKAIEYIEIELSQGGERELRDLVDGYEVLKLLKGGSDE